MITGLICFAAGCAVGFLFPPVGRWVVEKSTEAYTTIRLWLLKRKIEKELDR